MELSESEIKHLGLSQDQLTQVEGFFDAPEEFFKTTEQIQPLGLLVNLRKEGARDRAELPLAG